MGLAFNESAPDADNDHDGYTNLEEFLFGTNPTSPDSPLSLTRTNHTTFLATWKQRKEAPLEAIAYRLQESDDLLEWQISPTISSATTSPIAGYMNMQQDVHIDSIRHFIRAVASDW